MESTWLVRFVRESCVAVRARIPVNTPPASAWDTGDTGAGRGQVLNKRTHLQHVVVVVLVVEDASNLSPVVVIAPHTHSLGHSTEDARSTHDGRTHHQILT